MASTKSATVIEVTDKYLSSLNANNFSIMKKRPHAKNGYKTPAKRELEFYSKQANK